MAKTEKELIKLIDQAQKNEAKWYEEGQKLRAEYKKRFKKEI